MVEPGGGELRARVFEGQGRGGVLCIMGGQTLFPGPGAERLQDFSHKRRRANVIFGDAVPVAGLGLDGNWRADQGVKGVLDLAADDLDGT